MNQLPLFFTYHDRVFGKGFIADVLSHGRVLAAVEDDDTGSMVSNRGVSRQPVMIPRMLSGRTGNPSVTC